MTESLTLSSDRGKSASVGMGNVLSQEKREQVIRLQEQPLRILATLVEQPGAIATREELQGQRALIHLVDQIVIPQIR
jgi:DNA-binding response OmpR family regulator